MIRYFGVARVKVGHSRVIVHKVHAHFIVAAKAPKRKRVSIFRVVQTLQDQSVAFVNFSRLDVDVVLVVKVVLWIVEKVRYDFIVSNEQSSNRFALKNNF